MSDNITEYKCPACGGQMEFNSKLQMMKCPYCDTQMSLEEFEQALKEAEDFTEEGKAFKEESGENHWDAEDKQHIHIYVCESCGGEILADDTLGASSCPFCGNKIVMKGQFEGDLKPDYIIPFKLDKKDAKEGYLRHLKGKPFLPKIFKEQNHIDEIKGIYVPFWIFDAKADGRAEFKAERVRIWRNQDTEYTETTFYEVERGGSLEFEHVPEDGSEKMDDALMESVEPYDFKDAVPFKSAYLAGYLADRYDVEAEECIKRAKRRMKGSVEKEFRDTVTGYDHVTLTDSSIDVKDADYSYVLYPVWILNTTYKKEKYVFAMNGQTGKVVGNLPADKKAFYRFVGLGTLIGWVVIYLILSFLFM